MLIPSMQGCILFVCRLSGDRFLDVKKHACERAIWQELVTPKRIEMIKGLKRSKCRGYSVDGGAPTCRSGLRAYESSSVILENALNDDMSGAYVVCKVSPTAKPADDPLPSPQVFSQQGWLCGRRQRNSPQVRGQRPDVEARPLDRRHRRKPVRDQIHRLGDRFHPRQRRHSAALHCCLESGPRLIWRRLIWLVSDLALSSWLAMPVPDLAGSSDLACLVSA